MMDFTQHERKRGIKDDSRSWESGVPTLRNGEDCGRVHLQTVRGLAYKHGEVEQSVRYPGGRVGWLAGYACLELKGEAQAGARNVEPLVCR